MMNPENCILEFTVGFGLVAGDWVGCLFLPKGASSGFEAFGFSGAA